MSLCTMSKGPMAQLIPSPSLFIRIKERHNIHVPARALVCTASERYERGPSRELRLHSPKRRTMQTRGDKQISFSKQNLLLSTSAPPHL